MLKRTGKSTKYWTGASFKTDVTGTVMRRVKDDATGCVYAIKLQKRHQQVAALVRNSTGK